MTRGRRRGVETSGGRRFVTGCTLTPAGSPPEPARDGQLLHLAAATGVQLVHLHERPDGELVEQAHDLGLLVAHDLGPHSPRRPLRLGWERGDERDLPDRLRRPSLRPRIVTDFGAPSVAADADAGSTTDVAPEDLACLDRHTPRAAFDDDESWARATRDYHAMVVRFHVEAARGADRPTAVVAGPLWHPSPWLSPALLDSSLRPKEAYRALTAASRPRLAIADRLPPHLHGNEALALDVRVLNDHPDALAGALVTATLRWADGEQRYRYRADTEGHSARRVGTLQLVVPPVSGPLDLDVDLVIDDGTVTSTYRSEIFADPHDH